MPAVVYWLVPGDDDLLQQALDHHNAGRLDQASRIYRRLLTRRPQHPQALYLLGAIAYQTGNPTEAIDFTRKALAAGADPAQCHNSLGLASMAIGEFAEAERSFERAIAIQDSAAFANNLGNLYKEQGRLDDAIAAYQRALTLNPASPNAHYNLGNAHRQKGDLEQAAMCFRQAVHADPAHVNALAALGQVLRTLKRTAEAVEYLRQAADLLPGDAGLRHELGEALHQLGRIPDALAAFQQELAIDPALVRAWYSIGCIESSRENYVPAIEAFRKALAIDPQSAAVQHNLGQALFQLGQVDDALDLMRRAAAGGPPELPRAMIAVIIPGSPRSGNQAILDARSRFAEQDLPAPGPTQKFAARPSHSGRPLRVGYVSSLFHRENWMKPVWGLINRHDRARFAIHLLSDEPASSLPSGYRPHPEDRLHDISRLSNSAAAALIEESAIDLLIDLNGYSRFRRLPLYAMKPAPVIAAWFNMFATTGMRSFDYLIGDHEVIPPAEEQFYCEKIARVPGSYLSFEINYPVPAVVPPPCAAAGAITFGSLATQYKITSEVVAAWSQILRLAPGSSLLLKNSALGSEATRGFVHSLFQEHGIVPARVSLEGPAGHYDFLRAYDRIDIALDTFPYNGGTTTTEAIWQGVPVISFWGDRWASRTSASLLRAAGLGEFVAASEADYIALAVRIANAPGTPARLSDLRAGMRARLAASPVCDMDSFARNMEQLYVRMCA